MADKILCPWCGAEMETSVMVLDTTKDDCKTCFLCTQCRAQSPLGNTWTEAVKAALRRYTPPILCETCGEFGWDLPQCRNTDGTKYGRKECKYWSRKPTEEERSAAE